MMTVTDVDRYQTELDELVYNRIVSGLHGLPNIMKSNYRNDFIMALPLSVQDNVLRVVRSLQGASNRQVNGSTIEAFMGYKVVPGYEMAAVIFHPEAAIDPENGVYKIRL